MTDESKREHRGRTARHELSIQASPDEVFAAWAVPDEIARWFVDAASGECKPGSVMTWRFDAMGVEQPVPIVEAVPGERLAIAGELPGRPPFLLEVFIEAQGGATRLRLINSGFGEGAEWDDEYEGVDSGWLLALATLKHVLEQHPRGRRAHHFCMRPERFDYARLSPLYFTAAGIASWLAESARFDGGELIPGARVELDLGAAGLLDGRVLARSSRELLLSWPERSAAFALKAFSLGPAGRAIALDFNSWSDAARDDGIASFLDASLARLAQRIGD